MPRATPWEEEKERCYPLGERWGRSLEDLCGEDALITGGRQDISQLAPPGTGFVLSAAWPCWYDQLNILPITPYHKSTQ